MYITGKVDFEGIGIELKPKLFIRTNLCHYLNI
jgi:hypothetical protein